MSTGLRYPSASVYELAAYRLQTRLHSSPMLQIRRRLTQDDIVDISTKVENGRMNFIRFNVTQLRTEL